jgi:ubiquinone/menaquinone biosynthesis C-methylase UbiE
VPGRSAGSGLGYPASVRRFDDWAATYDRSQLQAVLYGPVHDAVLRYARQQVQHPGRILDVGCGTGRLSARLVSGYRHARVVGVDASTRMIRYAGATAAPYRAHFAAAAAEQLPFADAAFGLVVVTLSVAHWCDQTAGLAEIGRVMAPGATLVAADVTPGWRLQPPTAWARHRKSWLRRGLPSLIAGSGFRVECVEPIRAVAHIADAALVAARTSTGSPGRSRALPREHPNSSCRAQ